MLDRVEYLFVEKFDLVLNNAVAFLQFEVAEGYDWKTV
jgi:hypothetical protein